MVQFIIRLLNLIIGIFLYALGIVIKIKANIGYAPWDIFHMGLVKITGLSLGTISIIVGVLLVIIVVLLGEKLGLGSLTNMVMIGVFIDLIMAANVVPAAPNFPVGVVMMIAGLFILSLGSFFYIRSAFGAGPRDSLMVAVRRKTKWPVGLCRSLIELTVTLIGWLLGGMAGWGTLIAVAAVGFCIQITFKVLRFDPAKIKHETLDYTIKSLMAKKNS